jgi:hypothetical protein
MAERWSLIRFVGGPKHNSMLGVQLHPRIEFMAVPAISPMLDKPEFVTMPTFRKEEYTLLRFRTEYGTLYEQYVHESLLKDGELLEPLVYRDADLPELPSELWQLFEWSIVCAM